MLKRCGTCGGFLAGLLLLVLRYHYGMEFYQAGMNKMASPEQTLEFFKSLGIILPELSVQLVTYVEYGGGFLLMIGLFSRLVSIPLAITMIVALLTAHIGGVQAAFPAWDPQTWEFGKLFAEAPAPYLLTSLLVLFFGPGWASIDGVFKGIWNVARSGERS